MGEYSGKDTYTKAECEMLLQVHIPMIMMLASIPPKALSHRARGIEGARLDRGTIVPWHALPLQLVQLPLFNGGPEGF